jgi:hypothetical protein
MATEEKSAVLAISAKEAFSSKRRFAAEAVRWMIERGMTWIPCGFSV